MSFSEPLHVRSAVSEVSRPGKHSLTVHALCDSYVGIDQKAADRWALACAGGASSGLDSSLLGGGPELCCAHGGGGPLTEALSLSSLHVLPKVKREIFVHPEDEDIRSC